MSQGNTKAKKSSGVWEALRIILIIVLVIIIIVSAYVAYAFSKYYRLPDKQDLDVSNGASTTALTETEYKVMTYNAGFGAYEPDFSFFMDGGEQSWAFSKERVVTNMDNITSYLKAQNADVILLQEIDEDATRTYHVNERNMVEQALYDYDNCFAQNWDSPFLFYPLTQPHGKTRSGIITLSKLTIDDAIRRSVPVEDSMMKIVDLDRCYSKSYVPVEGGGDLVLYNVHLSAYTSDGTVSDDQLKMLVEDMENEYSKGNYTISGGDFNKDLLGDSSEYFGIKGSDDYSWCKPINMSVFEGKHLTLIKSSNAPSTRVTDAPYNPDQFVAVLDGFIVSDNVEVISNENIDTGFAYSDHNPVTMRFKLKAQ